jgi:hypothetical protein
MEDTTMFWNSFEFIFAWSKRQQRISHVKFVDFIVVYRVIQGGKVNILGGVFMVIVKKEKHFMPILSNSELLPR